MHWAGMGVSAQGGCLPGGVWQTPPGPPRPEAETPPPPHPVDRQTPVKT